MCLNIANTEAVKGIISVTSTELLFFFFVKEKITMGIHSALVQKNDKRKPWVIPF